MTTRIQGLEFIARNTGETFVTVENFARQMTAPQVPAPYNTTLGRGRRHARLSVGWLCSTLLAQVLGDPKNAAQQVPTCGDSRLDKTWLAYRQVAVRDAKSSLGVSARRHTVIESPAPSAEEWFGETVFDTLTRLVATVAMDWDGSIHQALKEGFKFTISTGKVFSAELNLLHNKNADGFVAWICVSYVQKSMAAALAADNIPPTHAPILRQAVIQVEHIEMLATLYAGTLRHEGALPHSTPSNNAPATADAGVKTKNAGSLAGEPAPSDCQPSPRTTDDSSTSEQTSGLDNHRCNSDVCVPSSGKSVRVGAATTHWRRQHALAPHHHDSA